MRYFARLDNETKGPFELWQLPGLGVTPDTYVWCQGMDQWKLASQVPEVSDFFRRRISNRGELDDPAGGNLPASGYNGGDEEVQAPVFPFGPTQEEIEGPDSTLPPRCSLALAILTTLFCFIPTGIVAIVYCMQSSRLWREASDSDIEKRRAAHDAARKARMWTGVTFFLGFIVSGLLSHILL